MSFYVYILASQPYGTLYTGHTDNLANRLEQHRTTEHASFVSRYGIKNLVWYERHDTRESALVRERQIKRWKRQWKINLICAANITWRDLSGDLA